MVVDNTIVNVAPPSLSRGLGASTTGLKWIVDAYSLAFQGSCSPVAPSATTSAAKRSCSSASSPSAVLRLAAASSHTTSTLIAARALMGAAAAFIFPATLAILTTIFPEPSERQKALGIWGATSGLAVASAPSWAGALLEHYWYGSVFLVNIPLVLLCVIGGQVLIPKLRYERPGRFDLRGGL